MSWCMAQDRAGLLGVVTWGARAAEVQEDPSMIQRAETAPNVAFRGSRSQDHPEGSSPVT